MAKIDFQFQIAAPAQESKPNLFAMLLGFIVTSPLWIVAFVLFCTMTGLDALIWPEFMSGTYP
jgi:hypothetical protein